MKRKRVSYTADFKLNAVEKANEVGNREAARFFNVDESNIRLWRRNKTSKIAIDVKGPIVVENLTGQN
ncbi:hypothetical protein TNCV_4733721 [Trichonephila clavipes]|nr:hypothetical protein TNCV_4733721 [Trichonephila clavipes]